MFKKSDLVIAKLGEKVLREKAKRVDNILDNKIQTLIQNMLYCVKKSKGVGLAAPQVFHSLQILVLCSKPNLRYPNAPLMKPLVMINPKIIKKSKNKKKDWEGCLSIPSIRALVPRHIKITVEYTTVDNETKVIVFKDFLARVFQHEYDHLIGKVYLDRVKNNKDIISEEIYFKNILKD